MLGQRTIYVGFFGYLTTFVILIYVFAYIAFLFTLDTNYDNIGNSLIKTFLIWTSIRLITTFLSIAYCVLNVVNGFWISILIVCWGVLLVGTVGILAQCTMDWTTANSINNPKNIANDPLYCCAFYQEVSSCNGFGPCNPIVKAEDLKLNRDFEILFYFNLIFFVFELILIYLNLMVSNRRARARKLEIQFNEEMYGYDIEEINSQELNPFSQDNVTKETIKVNRTKSYYLSDELVGSRVDSIKSKANSTNAKSNSKVLKLFNGVLLFFHNISNHICNLVYTNVDRIKKPKIVRPKLSNANENESFLKKHNQQQQQQHQQLFKQDVKFRKKTKENPFEYNRKTTTTTKTPIQTINNINSKNVNKLQEDRNIRLNAVKQHQESITNYTQYLAKKDDLPKIIDNESHATTKTKHHALSQPTPPPPLAAAAAAAKSSSFKFKTPEPFDEMETKAIQMELEQTEQCLPSFKSKRKNNVVDRLLLSKNKDL